MTADKSSQGHYQEKLRVPRLFGRADCVRRLGSSLPARGNNAKLPHHDHLTPVQLGTRQVVASNVEDVNHHNRDMPAGWGHSEEVVSLCARGRPMDYNLAPSAPACLLGWGRHAPHYRNQVPHPGLADLTQPPLFQCLLYQMAGTFGKGIDMTNANVVTDTFVIASAVGKDRLRGW